MQLQEYFFGSNNFGFDSRCDKKKKMLGTEELMFQTVVLVKTPESPLDFKKIKPVNPKGSIPEYSLEELMLKLKLQCFGYLMQRAESQEMTMMLGNTEGRRRGNRG